MPLDDAPQNPVAACRQPYPLPPDVRYVIDGMMEDSMLDAGSHLTLSLFAPRPAVMAILDGPAVESVSHLRLAAVTELSPDQLRAIGGRALNWRRALAARLLDLTDTVLLGLPQEVQNGVAAASLAWLRRDLESLAWCFADWTFEDATTGGAMKPFLPRARYRIQRNGEVCRRTARRLRSPAFIGRAVKSHRESRDRRAMATRILDRVDRATSLEDCLAAYAAELEQQRQDAQREGMLRFLQDADATRKIDGRGQRRGRRKRRAVIRRSLRVASAVLPPPEISAFVRGDGVRLPGSSLDLVVKLDAGLASRGHGVLDVTAVAPGSPEVLARLCVYHEKMPPLDQLAALSLSMAAGEEAEVIADANITTMLPAGRENALLAEREKKRPAPEPVPVVRTIGTTVDRSWWSHEDRRAHGEAYWQDTKAIWLERLAVFVAGRRVKQLGIPR